MMSSYRDTIVLVKRRPLYMIEDKLWVFQPLSASSYAGPWVYLLSLLVASPVYWLILVSNHTKRIFLAQSSNIMFPRLESCLMFVIFAVALSAPTFASPLPSVYRSTYYQPAAKGKERSVSPSAFEKQYSYHQVSRRLWIQLQVLEL